MKPICADVKVNLLNVNGNAFSVMAAVTKAMRKAKIDEQVIDCFLEEATSGDYDNLLRTCMKYVEVCDD